MAQAGNIYRRPSGIYAIWLVVPVRLRPVLGKTEVHASTGARTASVAKAIAYSLLAHWREKFLSLDRLRGMDLEKISLGSPQLGGAGYLRLSEAAIESGLTEDWLLRQVIEGRLALYVSAAGMEGYEVPFDALKDHPDQPTEFLEVPPPAFMPATAVATSMVGLLRVRNSPVVANHLLERAPCPVVLFDMPGLADRAFAPSIPVNLTRGMIEVEAALVEAARAVMKARLSVEHLEASRSRAAAAASKGPERASRRFSEALDAYMSDKSRKCASDHARRVHEACDPKIERLQPSSVLGQDRLDS